MTTVKTTIDPTFDEFMWLDNNLNKTLLCDIFGDEMGQHLNDKLIRLENVLYFYNSLDAINKHKIVLFIRNKDI